MKTSLFLFPSSVLEGNLTLVFLWGSRGGNGWLGIPRSWGRSRSCNCCSPFRNRFLCSECCEFAVRACWAFSLIGRQNLVSEATGLSFAGGSDLAATLPPLLRKQSAQYLHNNPPTHHRGQFFRPQSLEVVETVPWNRCLSNSLHISCRPPGTDIGRNSMNTVLICSNDSWFHDFSIFSIGNSNQWLNGFEKWFERCNLFVSLLTLTSTRTGPNWLVAIGCPWSGISVRVEFASWSLIRLTVFSKGEDPPTSYNMSYESVWRCHIMSKSKQFGTVKSYLTDLTPKHAGPLEHGFLQGALYAQGDWKSHPVLRLALEARPRDEAGAQLTFHGMRHCSVPAMQGQNYFRKDPEGQGEANASDCLSISLHLSASLWSLFLDIQEMSLLYQLYEI